MLVLIRQCVSGVSFKSTMAPNIPAETYEIEGVENIPWSVNVEEGEIATASKNCNVRDILKDPSFISCFKCYGKPRVLKLLRISDEKRISAHCVSKPSFIVELSQTGTSIVR